jgi:endonuclease/exonuclease/phosphatase family metal-dependent hydrolase
VRLSLIAFLAAADDAGVDAARDAPGDAPPLGAANLRVISGNLTSGSNQSYDPGEGLRIFEGLKPDVVLIQEFNYGANADADARAMVDKAFGANFSYYRETNQLPNGIISRFPILESGTWTDPAVSNRGFVWAKIAVPGARPLWAVSLHLLTTSAGNRDTEAQAIVTQVKANVPDGDYLVIGGDLNTDTRGESCMTTLGQVVGTAAPFPADGAGNENTSGTRTRPHDWVLADPDLAPRQVPTVYGATPFANGLVFDSRVYTPLADVAPILATDSAATNMQHMAVVKDFNLP